MKKIRSVILLAGILSWVPGFTQVSVGVFTGISSYQGDLEERPFGSPRFAGGITVNYALSSRLAIRGGLTFAKVTGADSLNKASLKTRNLSFQSPISELSLLAEFNTFDLDYKSWSPYIFGGVAAFHFNPYTFTQAGYKTYLQPLGTEGQGISGYPAKKKYSLNQFAVPIGGGVKFVLTDRLQLGVEAGLRILFTDYLDDVSGNYADANDLLNAYGQNSVDLAFRGDEVPNSTSTYPTKGQQRGSPKYNDFYYFTGLHLNYSLPEGNSSDRTRKAKKGGYGCPTVF